MMYGHTSQVSLYFSASPAPNVLAVGSHALLQTPNGERHVKYRIGVGHGGPEAAVSSFNWT